MRTLLLTAIALTLLAQTAPAQQAPLDDLVREGLAANLGLRQERLSAERAAVGVTEARGRGLPSLTLNARYSEVSGAVPDIGALVNPALGALNQLVGRNAFPTDIVLRLPQRQETTVRLTQPLFQPAVGAGVAIAKGVAAAESAQAGAAARDLAARVRLAYLDYAKAARVRELYDVTRTVVAENLRVNESLVANGKATPDAVFRARAELSDVDQSRADAARVADAARQQLNLLLERPLDAAAPEIPDSALGIAPPSDLGAALAGAAGREELAQVRGGIAAARGQRRLASASFLPGLVLAADYGFQGNAYRFTGDRDYAVVSLVFQWNLFNGFQDRARRTQAQLEQERLQAQESELVRRIAVQVHTAWDAAVVAERAIGTATDRLESARRSFTLVARRYGEGLASLVEFLDARSAFTRAGINRILTTFDYYQRCVELDRAAARYPTWPS